jgi:hypothetical protein
VRETRETEPPGRAQYEGNLTVKRTFPNTPATPWCTGLSYVAQPSSFRRNDIQPLRNSRSPFVVHLLKRAEPGPSTDERNVEMSIADESLDLPVPRLTCGQPHCFSQPITQRIPDQSSSPVRCRTHAREHHSHRRTTA